MGIADKGGRSVVQAAGKVTPQNRAGHVEKHLRQTVGGEFGNVAEDDSEDDGGHEGLDEEPEGTEDGLFIVRDEIAPHEEGDEVAVVPDFAELEVPPFFAGGDDQIPRFRR